MCLDLNRNTIDKDIGNVAASASWKIIPCRVLKDLGVPMKSVRIN